MKCPKCDGRGFVSMGEHIRGVKACGACNGTGEIESTEEYSYFKLDDFGVDDAGIPCPAGLKINLSFKIDSPKAEIEEGIAKILKIAPERVHMISKKEYIKDYDDPEMEG